MKRFKNILLVYQNCSGFNDAKRLSLELVKKNKARLTVVQVLPTFGDYTNLFSSMLSLGKHFEEVRKNTEASLVEFFNDDINSGLNIEFLVLSGRTVLELSRKVIESSYDLLIKPADETETLEEKGISLLDMRILRKCPCPIWIVKQGTAKRLKHIVAAIDSILDDEKRRELNQDIIDIGWGLSRLGRGDLDVLNVWDFDTTGMLQSSIDNSVFMQYECQALQEHRSSYFSFVQERLPKLKEERIHGLKGRTDECILEYLREHNTDVLVMGTVARTGVPGLLIGNMAERILMQVNCSVLAIKPKGFVSTVSVAE